jgi:hypothetical protein
MAWSKHSKNYKEERASGEGAVWIHQTSIDESIEAVRKVWKDKGIHADESDWELIQLAQIAVVRGLTQRAAPLVVKLMQKREADGQLRWNLDEPRIGAVGISMVRLLAAYIEDPAVSMSAARETVALFLRSIDRYDDLKPVRDLMPLILAARTEAVPTLDANQARKLPLRTDMLATGMCAATHRQWRVEYLLAMGAEDEAIELAHRGRSEKPCGETCAFAPHSMYAWLLEPLHRRGREEEARVLHDRLDSLMAPRLLYLNAMGHRIHYLTLIGRLAEASALLRAMLPMARETEASPWQRLKFYQGCLRALECASNSTDRGHLADDETVREIDDYLRMLRSAFRDRQP